MSIHKRARPATAEFPTVPDRVNVTLPDDCKDLFAWLVRHEPKFKGSAAAVAAALISKGAAAMYTESLVDAEPLDADVQEALGSSQRQALGAALTDDV